MAGAGAFSGAWLLPLALSLVLAGWMAVVFWPMLSTAFLFNDDALMFETGTCLGHPQVAFLPAIGRWLFPVLACPVWAGVDRIADLSWIRGLNTLGFAVVGGLFATQLGRRGLRLELSLALTALWLAGPAVQFQVILANSFPHPLGALLGIAAFLQAEPYALLPKPWRRPGAWLGAGLWYASACTYTPNALIYWVLLAARLTDARDEDILKPKVLGWLVAVGLLGSAGYTLTLKVFYTLVPLLVTIPAAIFGGHDASTVTSLWERLGSVLGTLVPEAWSFWGPPGALTFFWGLLALLGTGGLIVLRRAAWPPTGGPERLRALSLRSAGVMLCLAGILGPQTVAGLLALNHRTMLALSGLGLLLGGRALETLESLLPALPGRWLQRSLLLALLGHALLTIPGQLERQVVAPTVAEGREIQAQLQAQVVQRAPIHTIIVRRYQPELPIRPELTCSDELGLIGSTFPQNLRGLIQAHLLELGAPDAVTEDWELLPRQSLRRFGKTYGNRDILEPGVAELDLRAFADSAEAAQGWGCGTLGGDLRARGKPLGSSRSIGRREPDGEAPQVIKVERQAKGDGEDGAHGL